MDKLPTLPKPYFSFGTSLHDTLYTFHQSDSCRPYEELQEIYRRRWITETGYASPREEQEYFQIGLQILEDYHKLQLERYIQPIYLEERFRLEFDDYSLIGAIDRIDRNDEGFTEIIDYKTSKRIPPRQKLRNDLQLAIDGLAVRQKLGKYPDVLSFYYLRFNQKRSHKPDSNFFKETHDKLREAVDRIFKAQEHADFPARPGNLCPYCAFYSQCPAGNRSIYVIKITTPPVSKIDTTVPTFEQQSEEILHKAGEEFIDVQLNLLRTHFKFEYFRPGQLEVILAVLQEREVLAVMPTGAGKSLCYQLLSLQMEGLTVVISPLIALMKDQVEGIRELGFKSATFLNTSLRLDQYRRRISNILKGKSRLIYIAPEALRNRNIVRVLEQVGVSLLVIDEAHCISQWGHDFRPDYLSINSLWSRWPDCRVLAMTATATPSVQIDIRDQLGSRSMRTITTGFDRPNLFLEVFHVMSDTEKICKIQELLTEIEGDGIIYVSTRKRAEILAQELRD